MSTSTELVPVEPTAPEDEVRALARLAFDELAAGVGGIWTMQRGIAERVFWALGGTGQVVEWVYDAVGAGVYRALTESSRAAGRAGGRLVAAGGAGRRQLSTTPGGAALIGALNGLIGDALERERSQLHQPLGVRVDGRPVAPIRPELEPAFPGAGPRLVVFLHGLMETEFAWWAGAQASGGTYGARLAHDRGCTPVYVRYNSGRQVSENGASLAGLLEALVVEWPVEVSELALVGHSMGGLVARSACHQGGRQGAEWVRLVRHIVSLGTPHLGAPLAQAVHYAAAGLGALPETRALAAFLRRRSAGIRDLRQGSLVDEDWRGRDPDALRAAACQEVPLLEGVTHCFVSATVTRSARHPVGRLVGDTLVLVPSASGRGRTRRIPFEEEYGAHVGGTHHLALLNHPAVYERLRGWLAEAPRAARPAPR